MTERYTQSDVNRAAHAYFMACLRAGLVVESDGIRVQPGSRSQGNSWFLYVSKGGAELVAPPVGADRLGFTAKEAYDNITLRTRCIDDVRRLLACPTSPPPG